MSMEILPAPNFSEKKINLDFAARRTSFLPDGFAESFEKRETNFKAVRILECGEDDELFMYMGDEKKGFEDRPLKKFCTGSKYLGQWNQLGIAGKGIYKFPYGVIYDGYFNRNGEFHGAGVLIYPNGQKIEGIWKNGKLGTDCNFVTRVGIVMSKNYCEMPDRRFQIEVENDFNPPGQEYVTDEEPPARNIPEGCYDVVEGFFDPNVKTVYAYTSKAKSRTKFGSRSAELSDSNKKISLRFLFGADEERMPLFQEVIAKTESDEELDELIMRQMSQENKVVQWIPSAIQEDWIIKNCRKAWDEATGYRPDLYEEWTKGYSTETHKAVGQSSVEMKSKLESLKLSGIPSDGKPSRLTTFIKNRQYEQETVTVEGLLRMFKAKVHLPEINMKRTERKSFASEEILIHGEKRLLQKYIAENLTGEENE